MQRIQAFEIVGPFFEIVGQNGTVNSSTYGEATVAISRSGAVASEPLQLDGQVVPQIGSVRFDWDLDERLANTRSEVIVLSPRDRSWTNPLNQVYSLVIACKRPQADCRSWILEEYRAWARQLGPGVPTLNVIPLGSALAESYRPWVRALAFSACGFWVVALAIGLSASANRFTERSAETRIRVLLGATAHRLLWEAAGRALVSVSLSLAVGCVIAVAINRLATQVSGTRLSTSPSATCLAIMAGVGAFEIFLLTIPLLPAIRAIERRDPDARDADRWSGLLAGLQSTLCVVLLATGLCLASELQKTLGRSLGFEARRMVVARLTLPPESYPHAWQWEQFAWKALEAARATGGVEDAGWTWNLPTEGWFLQSFWIEHASEPGKARVQTVSPNYFRLLSIPLRRGAIRSGNAVAVVNDSFVKAAGIGRDPLGHRIRVAGREYRVEAVVGDTSEGFLHEPVPTIFEVGSANWMWLLAKGDVAPPALQQALRNLDPGVPVDRVQTLEQSLALPLRARKNRVVFSSIVAVLSLVAAAASVAAAAREQFLRRRKEYAIRGAVGASAAALFREALRRPLRTAGAGAALGSALSFGAISKLGVSLPVRDSAALILAAGFCMLAIAAAAALQPAFRAAFSDPAPLLRTRE